MWLDVSSVARFGHVSGPGPSVPTACSGLCGMQSRHLQYASTKHGATTSGSVAASVSAYCPLTIAWLLPGPISRPAVCTIVVLGNDCGLLLYLRQGSRLPAELGQGPPALLLLRDWCCCPNALRAPTLLTDHTSWSVFVLQLCRKGWDLIQVLQAVSTLNGGIPASALGQAARMLTSGADVTSHMCQSVQLGSYHTQAMFTNPGPTCISLLKLLCMQSSARSSLLCPITPSCAGHISQSGLDTVPLTRHCRAATAPHAPILSNLGVQVGNAG